MPKGETYVKVTGEIMHIVRLRPAYMSFGGYHWLSDLVRIAFYMAKRWPITAETKALVIEKANQAIHDAALENDSRTMHRYMKILVEAEKQNQADEHLQEEHERIDQGKLTGNIGHTVILDGPIRPQKVIATVVGEPKQITGEAPTPKESHDAQPK